MFAIAFSDNRKILHFPCSLSVYREHDYSLDEELSLRNFKERRIERTKRVLLEKLEAAKVLNGKTPKYVLLGDIMYFKSTLRLFGNSDYNFKMIEFVYSMFLKPPFKIYLFKLKVIFISLVLCKLSERVTIKIYENALLKLRST